MFGPLVRHRVGGEVHRTHVVAVDQRAPGEGYGARRGVCRSQEASAMPLATTRYSASALEREMTGWRLDDQDTRLPPRKTT